MARYVVPDNPDMEAAILTKYTQKLLEMRAAQGIDDFKRFQFLLDTTPANELAHLLVTFLGENRCPKPVSITSSTRAIKERASGRKGIW